MPNIDFHLDVGYKLYKYGDVDLRKSTDRAVDFPAMKAGNLDGGVFVAYLSDSVQDALGPQESLDRIRQQLGVINFYQRKSKRKIFIGIEGGRLINNNLDVLKYFNRWGITYLTLVHNRNLNWIDSATDIENIGGITDFGYEVIKCCEEQGILVDVSHSSDLATLGVIEHSIKPIIASHSGMSRLHDHPRNISNLIVDSIKNTDGVIGIPFVKSFLGDYTVAEHIDYAVQTIGIDHVGVGSDLDGAQCIVESVRDWEHWKEPLSYKGYSNSDIEKIAGGNWLRLLDVN